MLRRLLFLGVGALALVCVIGSPGQADAGHRRGGAIFGFRSRSYSGPRSGFQGFGGYRSPNFSGRRAPNSTGSQLDWVALG
jgi:hypothetical protein